MAYTDLEKKREYFRKYQREHRSQYKAAHRTRNREIISDFLSQAHCSCGNSRDLELAFGCFDGQDASQIGLTRLRSLLERATVVCPNCKKQPYSVFKQYKKKRRDATKIEIISYLRTHPCVDCGETDQIVLEFDHRNPGQKIASISFLLSQGYSSDAVFAEIHKCDVRCINCHQSRHISRSPEMLTYLAGKKCVDCGESRPEILHFDHREPSEKVHAVGRMIRKRYARGVIEAEIAKCDIRCAKCHRLRHFADKSVFYRNRQNDAPNELREVALRRFQAEPNKCFQRHMREVLGEVIQRAPLASLAGATVEEISWRDAKDLITSYEWLGTMAAGVILSYGLRIAGELIGAVCFNRGAFDRVRDVCGKDFAPQVLFLSRGACVPWAPKNSASYLIRHATKQALQYGYSIFVAYSDATAGEIGTVYQAVGWKYLGYGSRNANQGHTDMMSPDGERWSSYEVWKHREELRAKYELSTGVGLIQGLEQQGWQRINIPEKARYVWFEGPNKDKLMTACRHPFLLYPKRHNGQRISTPIIESNGNAGAGASAACVGPDSPRACALD